MLAPLITLLEIQFFGRMYREKNGNSVIEKKKKNWSLTLFSGSVDFTSLSLSGPFSWIQSHIK